MKRMTVLLYKRRNRTFTNADEVSLNRG